MINRNIVVVGGSAGAAESVGTLLKGLPPDLPASIFVVLHLSPSSGEWLPERFRRVTKLEIANLDGELPILERHVYLARPDRHLILRKGVVATSRGPRENQWRPAIDVLFRTAAVAYGSRVIGVLLSGELDDGTAGLQAICACGGLAIVQEPDETEFPAMPQTAIANLEIDHRLRLDDLIALLPRLVREPAGARVSVPEGLRRDALMAEELADAAALHAGQEPPTSLSCPECSGPLWRTGPDGMQFRCLVGHAYHLDSLVQGADQGIDRTLWAAIRLFEQRANIGRMMSEQERAHGREKRAELHDSRAEESHQHAQLLRRLHAQRRIATE